MQKPYSPPRSTSLSQPTIGSSTPIDPFGGTLAQAVKYALAGGAALGALYGTLFMPLIGTIIGALFGVALGLVAGIINGFVLGALTSHFFTPLTNARRYRRTTRLVALLTTSITALVIYRMLNIPLGAGPAAFVATIPALLAVGFAYYAASRGASWYVDAVGFRSLTLPPSGSAQAYDSAFLQQLFDDMQDTYELVCTISSFAFGRRWRRQLIDLMDLQPGMHALDLMSGTGETWVSLLPRIGVTGRLIAVDFTPKMLARARLRREALADHSIVVLDDDALHLSLPAASADAVICTYGVKTLSRKDQERFVSEVMRVLRPGGIFGIVEMSVPRNRLLRAPYLWYLAYVVPAIGALFLGNPDSYRMLSRYLVDFDGCEHLHDLFARNGCTVHSTPLFHGCATALVGMAPDR